MGAVSWGAWFFCFSFFVVPHNRGETEASLRPGRPAACGEISRTLASPPRKSIRSPGSRGTIIRLERREILFALHASGVLIVWIQVRNIYTP